MKGKKLALVDYSNLFYRGANVHTELQHKGEFTGALYGFLKGLAGIIGQVSPSCVVVCKDSKPYARNDAFPAYKAGRAEVDPDRFAQLTKNHGHVTEFLKLIGCRVSEAKGFEADDLMAILAARHNYAFDDIVLVSNDSDLFQLLDQKNLSVYLGKGKYMDASKFFFDNPTLSSCASWVEVAALAGSHNGTPGIPRVGVKTAIKIVSDKAIRQKYESTLKEYRRQTRHNRHLCKLPYPPLRDRFKEVSMDRQGDATRYDEREVIRFLAMFGITLTKAMADAFEVIAKGD